MALVRCHIDFNSIPEHCIQGYVFQLLLTASIIGCDTLKMFRTWNGIQQRQRTTDKKKKESGQRAVIIYGDCVLTTAAD